MRKSGGTTINYSNFNHGFKGDSTLFRGKLTKIKRL